MTVEFDDSGFRRVREKIAKLRGEQIVPLPELLPDSFIKAYTRFETLQAMLDAAGVKGQEDIESEAFSQFVFANSRFQTWEDMAQFAGMQYFKRKAAL